MTDTIQDIKNGGIFTLEGTIAGEIKTKEGIFFIFRDKSVAPYDVIKYIQIAANSNTPEIIEKFSKVRVTGKIEISHVATLYPTKLEILEEL